MKPAILLGLALPAVFCAAQVCRERPVPDDPPPELKPFFDRERGFLDPLKAGPAVGIAFRPGETPKPLPGHPAAGALLNAQSVRVDDAALATSRRASALAAAARISDRLDEFLEEAGPLSDDVRKWKTLDQNRRLPRMAADIERLVPATGWHATGSGDTFIEISAAARISPARLEPMVSAILVVDRSMVPRALAIRIQSQDELVTWHLVSTATREIVALRQLSFQGNSRFESLAVCRAR